MKGKKIIAVVCSILALSQSGIADMPGTVVKAETVTRENVLFEENFDTNPAEKGWNMGTTYSYNDGMLTLGGWDDNDSSYVFEPEITGEYDITWKMKVDAVYDTSAFISIQSCEAGFRLQKCRLNKYKTLQKIKLCLLYIIE